MPSLSRPAAPAPATHPILPAGLQRSHVEALLPTIRRRFRLSGPCALMLVLCIQHTRPSDWTSPATEPVCYARQQALAAQLGLTPRAVRYHEATLERAGLIAKTTAGDGSRGRYAGGAVVQGLNLTPLLLKVPALRAEAEAFAAAEARDLGLRRQVSAARRMLKRRVEDLLARHPRAGLTAELLALLAGLPRRLDSLVTEALETLLARLDAALHRPLPGPSGPAESSGVPEPDFRPHIQATTGPTSDSVTAHPADASDVGPPRGGPSEETKPAPGPAPVKPAASRDARAVSATPLPPVPLSPRKLYAAAGDDFRMYLDAMKGDRPVPSELDFVRAAIGILPEMGINPTAWDEAAAAMGDLGAALAVLVIEARRHEPEKPIRNPGGSLRAFARLAEKGQLNLVGSLIGLMARRGVG